MQLCTTLDVFFPFVKSMFYLIILYTKAICDTLVISEFFPILLH